MSDKVFSVKSSKTKRVIHKSGGQTTQKQLLDNVRETASVETLPKSVSKQNNKPKNKSPMYSYDLAQWFYLRATKVAECDSWVVPKLESMGIKTRTFPIHGSAHPFSFACRDAALAHVLLNVAKGKQQLTGLDLFGSPRTLKFNPAVSAPYFQVDGQSSKDMSIEWTLGPNVAVAGDQARGNFSRVPIKTGAKFDVIVAIDIYQCGLDSRQELSISYIKDLLTQFSNTGKMYWIGRKFPGWAGGDDPLEGPNGELVEQVYYRNEEQLIVSSPDETSGMYAPHPAPDWMFQRSVKGLDCAPITKVGPYHVICIALAKPKAVKLQPIPNVAAVVEQLSLEAVGVGYFRNFVTKRLVNVHVPTFLEVGQGAIMKVPNGQLLDMTFTQVKRQFKNSCWLNALSRRAPFFYADLVKGTTEACVYYNRDTTTQDLNNLRWAYAPSECQLVETRKATNNMTFVTNGSFFKTINVCLFAILAFFVWVFTHDAAAWILPSQTLLSAVAEEGLANLSPVFGLLGVLYEFTTSTSEYRVYTLWFQFGLFLLRTVGALPGSLLALILHLLWNLTRVTEGTKMYAEFREEYNAGRRVEVTRNRWSTIPVDDSLDSYVSRITSGPANMRGEIVVSVDGVSVDVPTALSLLSDGVGRNRTYPILITNCLLHQPAAVEKNLLAAVLLRIHNDPFQGADAEEVRHARWSLIATQVITSCLPKSHNQFISTEENITLMGKKGERLQRAVDDDIAGIVQFSGKTINLKWNETISAIKDVDGILTMKPRAIQNLPALLHARMGGEARSFAKELHDIFDGRVHCVAGIPIRVFFASGYTQAQLTGIADAMMEGGVVFAMSGDDSVFSWGGLRPEFGGEADQSAFDHTQDAGPMKFYMGALLSWMGFSKNFIAMAYQACASGYTIRMKRLTAKGSAGVQMPTGITTTTSFNSMSTFGMFVWFLMNRKTLSGLEEAGSQLGFKVKYFPSDRIDTLTFLKGWFQFDGLRHQWVPLPSAVVKLGKMITDPVIVTKAVINGKKVRRTRDVAIRMCASALASSYGNVDRDYPIFGEFLYTLHRLGVKPTKTLYQLQESWKPVMDGIHVFRANVLEAIEIRYAITPGEVVELEELLRTVKSLPAYLESTTFDKLCGVDY